MDKKLLLEYLQKLGVMPMNEKFTGQVTFSINMNQGGLVSIERNLKETIVK